MRSGLRIDTEIVLLADRKSPLMRHKGQREFHSLSRQSQNRRCPQRRFAGCMAAVARNATVSEMLNC
jgi:hypothetical protein